MPLQLGPMPNFNVQTPDVLGGQEKAATLASLMNENRLRQQLAPLQVQEQTEKAKQAAIATQTQQQDLDSRKAMMALIAGGELNKFAGVETPDGSGFDAAGAYQYMMNKGVLPAQAGEYANSWLTIGKNQAEISKNLGEAGKAQQEIREKTLKQVASKLGDIGDMSISKAANALDAFRQDLVRNPKAYTGLTQQEMAELYSADLTHLDALEGHLGIAAQVADFHKSKAEAINATPEGAAAKASAEAKAKLAVESSPEAVALAGKKASAEAAEKFPYELQLKQQETAQNPVFAVNPKTGQRELTTVGDAKAQGFTNPIKVSAPDVEKETALNSQMNDMQLNTSRYRMALNAMGPLSSADAQNIQRIITNPDIKGMLGDTASTIGWATGVGSMSQSIAKEAGAAWNALSPDKQEAVIGYLRMKNTGLLAQKVLTGLGRASKEALDIELANMPAPNEGATVGNKKLDAWQENLDQINSRSVKLPWMEQPSDVKTRIERQAAQQYNQAQTGMPKGQYRGAPSQDTGKRAYEPGMTVLINGRPRTVSKVFSDGSWDVQ
jgi:hypothetical protein